MKNSVVMLMIWWCTLLGAARGSAASSASSSLSPSFSPVSSVESSPTISKKSSPVTFSPLAAGVPSPELPAHFLEMHDKLYESDSPPESGAATAPRSSIASRREDGTGSGPGPKIVAAQTRLAIDRDKSMPAEIADMLTGHTDTTVDTLIDRFRHTKGKLPVLDYNALFLPQSSAQRKQKVDMQVRGNQDSQGHTTTPTRQSSVTVFQFNSTTPTQLKKNQLERLLALYYHKKNNKHDPKIKEIEALFHEHQLLPLTIPAYITRMRQKELLARKFINYLPIPDPENPQRFLVVKPTSSSVHDKEFDEHLMNFYTLSAAEIAVRMNDVLRKYNVKGLIRCEPVAAEHHDTALPTIATGAAAPAPGRVSRQRSKSR